MRLKTWQYLVLWAVTVFVVLIISTFLHEVGHGIGARIDGIHISTGFNKLGMPGKTPDDPDFRTGMPDGVWSGLLGPITTWMLAIGFTIALCSLSRPGKTSFVIGAFAVANGLIRAVPTAIVLLSALTGKVHMEDEAGWGVWVVTHMLRPELKGVAVSQIPAAELLSYPAVWIPPLLSLAISVVCLFFAFRHIFKLESARLARWGTRVLFVALALLAEFAKVPVINMLDRLLRINW